MEHIVIQNISKTLLCNSISENVVFFLACNRPCKEHHQCSIINRIILRSKLIGPNCVSCCDGGVQDRTVAPLLMWLYRYITWNYNKLLVFNESAILLIYAYCTANLSYLYELRMPPFNHLRECNGFAKNHKNLLSFSLG